MTKVRITANALKAIGQIMSASPPELSGAAIAKATGLASGTLYPLLIRLEEAGLLESRWEETQAQELGRPRRRFYRVTAEGRRQAQEAYQATLAPFGGLQWT